MELRSSYKQTEVGVIPEEWEVKRLGEVFSISAGKSKSAYLVAGGRYWVVDMGSVSTDGRLIVSKATNYYGDFLSDGDLVMPKDDIGGGGIIGKVGYIDANETYVLGDHVYRLTPNLGNSLFLSYIINGYRTNIALRRKVIGSAQLGLGRKSVDEQAVPFPSPEEQTAIAEALSDADALIEALEQLLAKKRQIKQGAMLELLTGKRRLSKFSDEWEVKRLRDLCTAIMDGTHFTPRYVDNGVPFYSVENVTADDFRNTKFISLQEHNRLIKRCKPEKGDILMTRIGSLGNTKLIDWDVNASIYVSLAVLKVNKQTINGDYLYCYTKSQKFIKDVELRSLINAIPQKINMENIGDVPILVPSPAEQTAIAAILSDMDAEIAALEAKLAKARQVRQGMMQELLTGRIRLA